MIKLNNSLLRIQDFEYLRLIGLSILQHFFFRQLLARLRFSRRIADHAGEVADQKNDLMAQFLKLFHLLDQHGVTQMQIRGGGIKTGFDF